MSENKNKKIKISKPVLKMFAAGFILFACAAAFTPSAGVLRTIPFFLVGGVLSHILSVPIGTAAALSAIMTLCTYLASGRGVGEAVLYAAISALLTSAGVYIVRFFKAAKKTQKKFVKKKCVISACSALVVSVVLSLVLCGNIVSFLINDSRNTEYIEKNYGETVEKRYSNYEALQGEYRTYVSFKDEDGVYGNADECYIGKDGSNVFDDVRNHYEENMLYTANAILANVISGATWGYNISASDIAFSDGEILTSESNVDDYMNRVSYVVSFESIFTEKEKDKFASVCADTVEAIVLSSIPFERIVLCGGDASEVLFSLEVTPETEKADVYSLVTDFDEKQVEALGVTEMTILDYWKNK